MDLPKLINNLIRAQNNLDGMAFSACLEEEAIVEDEGRIFNGRTEVKVWIEEEFEKYQFFLKPLDYREIADGSVLKVEAHGNFKGSPGILKYHIKTKNGLIHSLSITG